MKVPGSTKESSLVDLVQANAMGRNTCRVTVATAKGKGTFHIENGEIVDAAYGDLAGEAAFYSLMNAADSTFSVNTGVRASVRRITTGHETLMLNAMTLRFEGRVPQPTFGPPREPSRFETEPFGPVPGSTTRGEPAEPERTIALPVPAAPRPVEPPMVKPSVGIAVPAFPAGSTSPARPGYSPTAAPPAGGPPASPTAAGTRSAAAARPAEAVHAPSKKGLGGIVAAGLLLLVAASAYLLFGRSSPSSARSAPGATASSAAPVEPIESATLTGAGDVQPELVSGEVPRSPDPESAVSPSIVCRILIAEDGAVKEASVFRSRLDLAKFEEAAIAAVKTYRFRPAVRAGRPVPVRTNFPVTFR